MASVGKDQPFYPDSDAVFDLGCNITHLPAQAPLNSMGPNSSEST